MPEKARSNLCAAAFGVAFVTLIFFTIWSSTSNPGSQFLIWSSFRPKCHAADEHDLKGEEKEQLESILTRISAHNKTLIIAVVNKAYVENDNYSGSATMLDTFLESFWLGENTRPLLDNLLLVGADRTAYDRCRFLKLNCYKMETDGVDFGGEKLYMSDDFIKMMWRRTRLLLDVLKLGFSFIFTDIDVMWVRNPFKILSNDTKIDLQLSCDNFNGDSYSTNNPINTGFYFVRSNSKTIALFEKWDSMKDNSAGQKEQDVLANMIRDNIFQKLNIMPRYLDPLYFNGFCSPRRDIRVVTTVHANCCRSIRAKVSDLTAVLRDWQVFKRNGVNRTLPDNKTISFDWSKPVNCLNSWS